ncbi:HNH endonuclease signature motif containing protein [Nocardioides dubius]
MPVLQARLTELNYRLLACALDVADAHGARNIGDYLAHETKQAHGTMARELRIARELDSRWMHLHAALREGRVNLAQSVEITRSLNALPDDLDATVVRDAERTLVEHAEEFGPNDLRRMGKRIIDVVAPEIAEAVEGKRLADEERSARERQQLTLKPQGDGTTRISGLLTDGCANRLATALNAITNPRRDHLTPAPCGCAPDETGEYAESCGDLECPGSDTHQPLAGPEPEPTKPNPVRKLSTPQRNARALNTLLETLDPKRLPLHGGDATTVVVTISLDALRNEIGTATLTTQRDGWHDRISAGEARRLACNAGIIPAVLDGQSQPLDLGRTKRFYSAAQHRALALMHPYCRAENCRIPATWCEAHHNNPWHLGGRTDLADGSLLCSKHHHYIHDPTYTVEYLPHGGIRFRRRT